MGDLKSPRLEVQDQGDGGSEDRGEGKGLPCWTRVTALRERAQEGSGSESFLRHFEHVSGVHSSWESTCHPLRMRQVSQNACSR